MVPGAEVERDSGGLELIAKTNSVLDTLEQHGEASAQQIALATGEPLSSVYRLLQSLVAIGWVDRGSHRGGYRLGLALMTIGGQLEDKVDIREVALPALRRLLQETKATSFLCVRRGPRAVCIERLEGHAVRSLAMQLGNSLPLFSGAAPRALFAFLPAPERHAALRDFRPQVDEPPAPAVAAFDADMAVVHRNGFAVSDEDVTPGIAALGAPVFNHRGEVVAAISISGLRSQILGDSRERNVDLLLQQASAVSATLGYDVTAGGDRDG